MKRFISLLLLLLTACCQLYAGDRTEKQMKEIAANALSAKTRRAASVVELKEFLSLSKLKVYGYENGGFAVVPSDDRYESVIGISISTFDGPLPCGFKWWIESVNEVMEKDDYHALAKRRASNTINATGAGPLITTKWGQSRPYNNQCVLIVDGQEYRQLTGCVATAMAQVMNYYKYPTKGKGENSYTINYSDIGTQTFSANFEDSYYDWGHMLDDYSAYYYSTTEDQYTDAVSKLMSDCGIAVNMKYTTYSSGTYADLIPIAMKNYFSYSFIDNTNNIYYRNNYSNSDEWMNMVYNALNNNHPIIYCGSKGLSGHCFVIHGYDPDGKVIVNWGWNGSYDGSFSIDMLNPGPYSYNDNQNMVIPVPEEQPVVSNTYKLTYLVDGEIYKEYELNVGNAITPEPAPTKAGYTFSGWSNIPSTMPNHDVAVNGYFYDSLPSANTVTVEINGIYYILIGKSNTAEVTSSPNKYSGDITIPETVDYEGFTYKVTQIGEKAFDSSHNLTSVIIPNSVTSIGKEAFAACWNLSSIDIPNSVQDIGSFAFSNCTKLSSIVVPDGITTIRMSTFYNCKMLISVKIPDTVTSFEGGILGVFESCSALESISLPPNLTMIGTNCFKECESLTSIVIPDKVSIIYGSSFYKCTNLKTITIGKSVININSKAFAECKSLGSFVCLAENPPTTNNDAFENSYIEYVTLYVPDASVCSYQAVSPWNLFGSVKGTSEYNPDDQQPPSLATEISGIYYILIGKSKTAEVTSSPNKYSGDITIPETVDYEGFTYKVTQIGEKAFDSSHNLTSVIIPNSVTSIGKEAFAACWNLSSIDIPNSVQDIGSFAFSNCTKLSSIVVPDGITTIRMSTFYNCKMLISVKIPDTVTSFEGGILGVFESCSALESISLPPNLTMIGTNCFKECESLTSIVIPDKVSIIYGSSFYKCTNLKTITIGKSVININSKAFAECKSLGSFVCLAENPPTTNNDAFENSYIEYVTLYVPENSVSKYRSQEPWNKFGQIVVFTGNITYTLTYKVDGEVYKTYQLEVGATITPEPAPTKEGYTFSGWSEIPATMPAHDVIVTGTFERVFNVGDVVNIVNFIMNANATANDIALYDMNNDGELNIGDIVLIVKSILNNGGSAASPAIRRASGIADFAQYTATQFELKVDKNAYIKDIHLVGSMTQSHQLMCQQKDDNTYDIVIFSLSNQLMSPENGNIVEVDTDGSDVIIQNVIVANPSGEVCNYQNSGTITGVHVLSNSMKPAVIYDLMGNCLDGKGLKKGVYIINGKKAVVK